MSVSVDSARGKAGYLGHDFVCGVEEFGGEVRLHGPRAAALGVTDIDPEAALHRALTDGFLERRQANFTPGWVVTLTTHKSSALAVNGSLGPDNAKVLNTILRESAEETIRPYADGRKVGSGRAGPSGSGGTGCGWSGPIW